MSWTCPACSSRIRLTVEGGRLPRRPETVYRCHGCRLELVLDPRTDRLILAPLEPAEPPQ
jgi:DNA-directed RNA polymerase subunit RPC12/RpoP